MKLVRGKTAEEQIRSIDGILNSWSRKMPKRIVGVITPFPISSYASVPVNKVVLRYMFPADGTITIGVAFIENMPKEGVDIYINLHRGDAVESTSVFTKKQAVMVEPNAEILVGDRLVVSVDPKGQGEVSGIWASFLWTPKIKDAEIRQYLIEDLERIGEENAEG